MIYACLKFGYHSMNSEIYYTFQWDHRIRYWINNISFTNYHINIIHKNPLQRSFTQI